MVMIVMMVMIMMMMMMVVMMMIVMMVVVILGYDHRLFFSGSSVTVALVLGAQNLLGVRNRIQ